MQTMKQPYRDVMTMPIDRFYSCLKWKSKFDEEVRRLQDDELGKV